MTVFYKLIMSGSPVMLYWGINGLVLRLWRDFLFRFFFIGFFIGFALLERAVSLIVTFLATFVTRSSASKVYDRIITIAFADTILGFLWSSFL
jgi:hypothetical protein